jgi:predicted enzyme related to lactoylglutathione lyase
MGALAGPSRRARSSVLYAIDLEAIVADVKRAGGTIVKPNFSFPGGPRFHVTDPAGNAPAVWSET